MSDYPSRGGDDPNDPDTYSTCSVCGTGMDRETCWYCGGAGGFHDCGEDCCCCLEPDLNVPCAECDGRGWYWICPRVPHQEGYPL